MASSSLTVRIDSGLKDDAASVAEYYGLDLSSIVRAFFMEIVNTRSIPLSLDYGHPNEESLAAIRETEKMISDGSGKAYSSGRDLIDAALA